MPHISAPAGKIPSELRRIVAERKGWKKLMPDVWGLQFICKLKMLLFYGAACILSFIYTPWLEMLTSVLCTAVNIC